MAVERKVIDCLFFFQAEDGIRDFHVTGVQTCALPIWTRKPWRSRRSARPSQKRRGGVYAGRAAALIGSQKNAETVPGPDSSKAWSSASRAASPPGSKRQVLGGMCR